ncbi:hypothetical protein ACKUE8_27100, partial [Escherichia coli]|uniref:hypothetical protein n=1 Tax=Escherichia coli TaxID=562 RepID=UPI00390C8A7C
SNDPLAPGRRRGRYRRFAKPLAPFFPPLQTASLLMEARRETRKTRSPFPRANRYRCFPHPYGGNNAWKRNAALA